MIIKDQDGATVVEFGLILPLLILLLFGIIEFGLLLFNKHVLTNAFREGGRAGIIVRIPRLNNTEIKNVVKNYASSYLVTFGSNTFDENDINIATPDDNDDTNGACVCSNPDSTTDERCLTFGCDLKIEGSYDYHFLVLSALGFGPITLNNQTTMKME